MDVREKLVEQAISHFWYGVSHDIFSEPVTTYAKLAIEALEKEKESGVTVQSEIDSKTFRLMRECERLKEEKESLANAVNVLEEINSDLCKQVKGVTVQEWISVSEPPKERGCYLVSVKHWLDGKPVTREAKWNGADWLSCYKAEEITPRVTHWTYLPQPPKGE